MASEEKGRKDGLSYKLRPCAIEVRVDIRLQALALLSSQPGYLEVDARQRDPGRDAPGAFRW